jgi:hypothetical protein
MFIDLRLAIGSRSSGAQRIEEHVEPRFRSAGAKNLKGTQKSINIRSVRDLAISSKS